MLNFQTSDLQTALTSLFLLQVEADLFSRVSEKYSDHVLGIRVYFAYVRPLQCDWNLSLALLRCYMGSLRFSQYTNTTQYSPFEFLRFWGECAFFLVFVLILSLGILFLITFNL